MAFAEKRAGKYISYAATGMSVFIAGFLYFKGLQKPEYFTASMTVNHHNSGYAKNPLSCYDCHGEPQTPVSLGEIMTCYTAKCHGELQPNTNRNEGIQILEDGRVYMTQFDDFEERANHYLEIHEAVKEMRCTDCHKEHEPYKAEFPPGFGPYQPKSANVIQEPKEKAEIEEIAAFVEGHVNRL